MIITKARLGLPLTPGERAFLKLLQGWFFAAVITVLPVLSALLNGQTPITRQTLLIAAGALASAFLSAAAKYYTAQGDAIPGQLLQAGSVGVAQATGSASIPAVPPIRGTGG